MLVKTHSEMLRQGIHVENKTCRENSFDNEPLENNKSADDGVRCVYVLLGPMDTRSTPGTGIGKVRVVPISGRMT